jgi:hypothetical protein
MSWNSEHFASKKEYQRMLMEFLPLNWKEHNHKITAGMQSFCNAAAGVDYVQ